MRKNPHGRILKGEPKVQNKEYLLIYHFKKGQNLCTIS